MSATMNERALRIADEMVARAADLRIAVHTTGNGARVVDCGVKTTGGIGAGLALARVCVAGLANLALVPGNLEFPLVQLTTDHPVRGCMASQYAGWQVSVGKFFAMGSGPMRAAYGREPLFNDISGRETPPCAVGVLETRKLPTDEVVAYLAEKLDLAPDRLTLLVAPASSMAGTVQVVARALETALHKLHELEFDLGQVVSGYGSAPLPPVGDDEMSAIGRTNDAILYGGRAVLWVRGDDDRLLEIGPKVPSSASPDHGAPFAELFARAGNDFYKIDPMLFSPAEIVFQNLQSGRVHVFGRCEPAILRESWGIV
jgi:methenyltetrahydromethanopterin cyclohydrolase